MEIALEERQRIEFQISRIRKHPSYSGMLDFVRTIDACVVSSASVAGIAADKLSIFRNKTLQDAFCFLEFKGPPRNAVDYFNDYLSTTIEMIQHDRLTTHSGHDFWFRIIDLTSIDIPKLQESFAIYNLAVSTIVSEQVGSNEAVQVLSTLMASFDLSFDELGRMFGVTGETVRRWETGTSSISNERKAEITLAREPLSKLLKTFRSPKLPQVIRRPAELFNGERALDWILRGKIADVANRYEIALRYQA